MNLNINDNLFLIKNTCNGCIHYKLCKYKQEKEVFENLIMEEKSKPTSPIKFSLDCEEYQSNKSQIGIR